MLSPQTISELQLHFIYHTTERLTSFAHETMHYSMSLIMNDSLSAKLLAGLSPLSCNAAGFFLHYHNIRPLRKV